MNIGHWAGTVLPWLAIGLLLLLPVASGPARAQGLGITATPTRRAATEPSMPIR